ncbi:MAG: gluconokinase [Pseudotabrizicola sp.]|uniref:gluconokinase n=1 Tax=Pseudotabrizicola sp. TaxID=2939647 RepID=UPI002721FD2C|nr:gluconokinase [Pseudotabrizicola sp.]MDO8884181.1 gluconokinase [Pseudotabrizicola sp.]MDP2081174.1 gluconokinase [Pseudotabrizicola sp.]MDZ7573097.1 gluconokinase [Pseudotabrizicola sp.]
MNVRVVIMGVSGCGKSSVGEGLSARLCIPYRDGDDLHPAENVDKMRTGVALTDDDRWPWLDRVAAVLANDAPVIVGCSALRRTYRDRLRAGAGGPVQFVHLSGSLDLIAGRMATRTGHYMPTSLLDSQFAALEPPGPDEALTVSIDQPLPALIDTITTHLEGAQP